MNFYIKHFLKKLLSAFDIEIKRKSRNASKNFMPALTYKSTGKFICIDRNFSKVSEIDGDVVECGVGKARTFSLLAHLVSYEGKGRKLWGFDSFEGFPEPSEKDKSPRNPQKGEWNEIDVEMVYKILIGTGLSKDFLNTSVIVMKGFFEETLPRSKVQKIAFLHLDVDLYKSYKTCLKELFPRVVMGGVVVFDEYGDVSKFPGAKKAIDEYFKNTNYIIQRENLSGKYYVVKK